jgi:hypothetical protein
MIPHINCIVTSANLDLLQQIDKSRAVPPFFVSLVNSLVNSDAAAPLQQHATALILVAR